MIVRVALALLLAPLASIATPLIERALLEVRFRTESGYEVHLIADGSGLVSTLTLSCSGGAPVSPPPAAYGGLRSANINEARLFEDVFTPYVRLDIPSYEFDAESGNATAKTVWSFVFRDCVYQPGESGTRRAEI